MADSNSLRIMCIFEAGSRLNLRSELTCLAAHIYHRFFRVQQQTSMFDLYMFSSASLLLAHAFYEEKLNTDDLILAMSDILHGQDYYISDEMRKQLTHSMEVAARVICTNLDYQITFKDTRLTTPGLLQKQNKDLLAEHSARNPVILCIPDPHEQDSSSSSEESDDGIETKADRLLIKNDRYKISSHRYLVHYLKIIKSLVKNETLDLFTRIANVAWTFLCDYHWSPCVTQICSNHLACTCLAMAIEVYRPFLENSKVKERAELWQTLKRKWNLVLCDDFDDKHLKRATTVIIEQYDEYERTLQLEFNTYVIDPLRRY